MSNLTTSAIYDDIYQLETTDQVLGGPTGIANTQAKQLGNRTDYLKARVGEAVRFAGIKPVSGNYGVVVADFGKVISVADPVTTDLTLPPLNQVPKNYPVTIVVADVGTSDTVAINAGPGELIENIMNDGDGIGIYDLKQGCRIILIATETSWVVIQKTEPTPEVFGFLPGDVVSTAANVTSRTGFLLCDGSAVSRSTYAALFAAIGTTYGIGNGATTFNVPDHGGLFLRAYNGGSSNDPGRTFGMYQADDFKSHTHDNGLDIKLSDYHSQASGTDPERVYIRGGDPETEATGGTETRPRNQTVNTFIKF